MIFTLVHNKLNSLTVTPGDYVSEQQIIRFSACETQKCANVTIVDDSVDEPEERFFYTLMRSSGLDSRITLGPTTVGEVVIMDNESIYFNTQLYYSVKVL